eukprot:480565-Amphidinium_carterae.1
MASHCDNARHTLARDRRKVETCRRGGKVQGNELAGGLANGAVKKLRTEEDCDRVALSVRVELA